jgi:hypothetical protein
MRNTIIYEGMVVAMEVVNVLRSHVLNGRIRAFKAEHPGPENTDKLSSHQMDLQSQAGAKSIKGNCVVNLAAMLGIWAMRQESPSAG